MTPGDICYLRCRIVQTLPWPGDEKRPAAAVVLVSRVGVAGDTVYYVDPKDLIPAAEAKK